MHVTGYRGKGLVNSFLEGDRTTGTLTSPPLTIERRYLSFLIGGGGYAGTTCMNLLHEGKVVRTTAGPNTEAGGSEELVQDAWDLADLSGKTVTIQIVDKRTGGWGHVNVDHIVLSAEKPRVPNRRVGPTTLKWKDLTLTVERIETHGKSVAPIGNRTRFDRARSGRAAAGSGRPG